MENPEVLLPSMVQPVVTKINQRIIQVGLMDKRSGDMIDCCRYVSDGSVVTTGDNERFFTDYRRAMIKNGVV